MKILVVEDDRRILTFLKRALEAEGHLRLDYVDADGRPL